ncbi:hypothetical protein [Clostridium sp. JN-9]|mgnify:FL=1|uniref:SHOCT-like domain-containing protein n=1 Tax=Clostridium sp. JN-9 TaxID=2507159 RepID=UPI000FFE2657|nr:hypothetical protein [Clostridium sp. JN-9]QAT39659.1 hypothetical protein EQM05_04990 [Clostridium sp. JN-9]
MNEEVSKILKMVEDGKITADKAQQLIEALSEKPKDVQVANYDDIMNKMLKIRVSSHDGDKVNVTLPIKLIKTMLKTFGKIPMYSDNKYMENVDITVIADAIDNGLTGKIVDVNSSDGDIVEISIE